MNAANGMKDITQEEVSKLTKAMKDDKFRECMDEYCKETSDPANRKEYLEYLDQLESKGEMPEGQQLLRCQPGCCVKTTICFKSGQRQKCFINIVHSERLDDLSLGERDQKGGKQASLPYSLGPPRPDRDNKGEYCMLCDFAVSTRTFFMAAQDAQIMKMLVDTAADGLGTKFLQGYEDVMKDFKVLRRVQCKGGTPMPMSVHVDMMRDKGKGHVPVKPTGRDAITPSELQQMRKDAKEKTKPKEKPKAPAPVEVKAPEPAVQRIRVPQHRLVHSGCIDLTDYMESSNRPSGPATTVPKLLKLIVELPTVKKVGDISLEVTSDNVVVEVEDKYYLDLPLPYEVEDGSGGAKFDKVKQELTLELPVKPKPPDPRMLAAARGLVSADGDDGDGALSEGREASESETELPPLEEEKLAEEEKLEEPVAEEPAPPSPPAAVAPPRERLEFEPEVAGGALRIAPLAEEVTPSKAMEELEEVEEETEELFQFIPAEAFEGAKSGFYFSTGAEGLGYYRDKRQPRARPAARVISTAAPAREDSQPADAPPAGPLVTEVDTLARVRATDAAARRPLPTPLRRYVARTAALTVRVAAADADNCEEEPPLECHQGRQNLMLSIGVPARHEVADVRLGVTGARLAVFFCTRPARPAEAPDGGGASSPSGSSPRWCRRRLRRVLCGDVDAQQWHADFAPTRGTAGDGRLTIVLRKADQAEMWPDVFVDAATCPAGESFAALLPAIPLASRGDAAAQDTLEEDDADGAAEAAVDDSAELDVAGPAVVHGAGAAGREVGGAGAAAGPALPVVSLADKAAATKSQQVQSAAAVGHGVQLQTRLMYKLL